jgi:hypothetical protein
MKPAAPRNLFNGDCNFFFYNPELWQPEGGPYSARAIDRCVGQLAACGVDTLLVNPNTQVAWYPSARLEHVFRGYRRGDRRFISRIAAANAALTRSQVQRYIEVMTELFDRYLDLQEAGTDWLAEAAHTCRRHGVTPWLSYRMNATHFSGAPDSPVNCRLFREARYRLSGRVPGARGRKDHAWLGLNYGCAPVRDYMFEMIQEGVETYGYDGVELDWLRHPLCVEAPASQRDTDAITGWIGDLRALTRQRQRSLPLGLRVPGNLDYLRSIGIDLRAMVGRRLIDFVSFSNYWQTSWTMPLDDLRRELGPEIRIYAGMEGAPNWLKATAPALVERPAYQELQLAGDSAATAAKRKPRAAAIEGTRYLPASAPFLRGNAAGKLVLPVDGLEQFNFFVADQVRVPGQRGAYEVLLGLADLTALRGKEKHYAFNTASGNNHEHWDAPMSFPAEIPAGQSRTFPLPMCAEPKRSRLELVVQVIARRPADLRLVGTAFNGEAPNFEGEPTRDLLFPCGPYRQHTSENVAWNFRHRVSLVRDGWNEITVHNRGRRPLTLVCVEPAIRKFSRSRTARKS